MKKNTLLLLTVLSMVICSFSHAQVIEKPLGSFHRIIASPKINLVLNHGEQEAIKLVYNGVSSDAINIEVKGNTLSLYLDDARITEKPKRRNAHDKKGIYEQANITAYVTYEQLNYLEIRGNQELTCRDHLQAETFKLKAYGANEINLASIKTEYLKMHLYGENTLRIKNGKVEFQKYKLYGENRIDTRGLKSIATKATIYGESRIRVHSADELHITSFGEADVAYTGNANVTKGFVFGKTKIRSAD